MNNDTIFEGFGCIALVACMLFWYMISYAIEPVTYTNTYATGQRDYYE